MKDTKQVCHQLFSHPIPSKVRFSGLVPNLKGLEGAVACSLKEIAVITSTSETFNKKNINCSISKSLEMISKLVVEAKKHGLKVRGYISTVFGCPYEGDTSLDLLAKIMDVYASLGIYEVSLGDTIGIANPKQTQGVLRFLGKHFDLSSVAMHFHDTRGMSLANALVSLEEGVSSFDSSAGGLGGCPYAQGATGNVATEDLVYFFHAMGHETGIDLHRLIYASEFIENKIQRPLPSKIYQLMKASKIS
jgi:hydroxymethylglutaryl-CoA lyase